MVGRKLFQVLIKLTEKEIRRFELFVRSPYFNKHEGVKKVVQQLVRIHPDYNEETCGLKVMAIRVFGGNEEEARKQLGPFYTYTSQLLDRFLIHQQLDASDLGAKTTLLKSLRQKKMNGPFEKKLRDYTRLAEKMPIRDQSYYQFGYEMAAEADRYYDRQGSRKKDHNIELKHFFLDRYYLTEKLRDACEIFTRSKILDISYENYFLPVLLAELERRIEDFIGESMVITYYHTYLMLTTGEEGHYFTAWKTLQEHIGAFTIAELKTIYNYFQNFCINKINDGNQVFLKEIFKLYQSQLEKKLLLEDGYLSEWHYKNIVTTGLRLGEMDWVQQFIEDYKINLWPNKAENAYRFNLANFYYATHQYDKVLKLLIHVEYSDLRYSLGSRALLLRTYYDLGAYEPLDALADSFRHFLLRNKLMANVRRRGYSNLFRLTRKAAQLRATHFTMAQQKALEELRKLKLAMDKAGSIFNEAWLREKIVELEREITA